MNKKKIKVHLIGLTPGFFIRPNHFVSGPPITVDIEEGTTISEFFDKVVNKDAK